MAIPTIREYFESQPLTSREVASRRVLRVVGCLRSAEGVFSEGPCSFVWIVLSGAIKGERPPQPAVLGFGGGGRIPRLLKCCPATELAEHNFSCEGDVWTLREFEFVAPVCVDRLMVTAGTLIKKIGRTEFRKYIDTYNERISNASIDNRYSEWLASQAVARRAVHAVPISGPLMSIVTPAFNTPPAMLEEMIESVVAQTYQNWELVIVNASPDNSSMCAVLDVYGGDPRIKVIEQPDNLGIAGNTNIGIRECCGDFISFFDHDDTVEPDALSELVRAINLRKGDVDLLYCDEDNIDEEGRPFLPLLKPEFNPDFLLSNNYVIHWLTVRRELLERVELSDQSVNGAQDYDMTFKISELGGEIVRVPHVLYHWRIHSGSTAGDPGSKSYAQDAGAHAIKSHLMRIGADASVRRGPAYFTYEVRFSLPSPAPRLIVACREGCSEKTKDALQSYTNTYGAEVCFVETRTDEIPDLPRNASGVLLLTTHAHDLALADLETLVGNVCRPGVFAVSPRVVRSDGLLDYAGTLVLPNGELGRLLRLLPEGDGGYVGRAQRPYDSSAPNSDCCLMNIDKLRSLGMPTEISALSYRVADLCLQARDFGWRTVFMPYATAQLNSPATAMGVGFGEEDREAASMFLARHPELRDGDPSHNPNFNPWSLYYRLA